ncbi:MAG: AAA family ATPase, partial [Cyanobacteria bacterium REEB65]|nr:AAA family ATPase [Cyanobacteria bacterium REEB65]
MESLLKTAASYIPDIGLRQILRSGGQRIESAQREDFEAAVLLADVSGFTRLTETLAKLGPEGAEEMTRALNGYLGQLIEIAHRHAGDVVKFAGDAMLILWPRLDTDRTLVDLTLCAAQCALAMQRDVGVVESVPGASLSLHCAIGAGPMATLYLGGVNGHWESAVTGPALANMSDAARLSSTGEVVLSPDAWKLIAQAAAGTPLVGGCVRIDDVTQPVTSKAKVEAAVPPEYGEALQSFLPVAVRSRMDAGQTSWLAELRRLTVLFVNLPGLNHTTSLDQSQAIMQALQASMFRFEGSINKLSVDEKGISMVAALGLPPLSHSDDPARAIGAALAIHEQLKAMGVSSSIGVTTGRAFCGEVGNGRRREYTMMGDVVNLAARLMAAAKGSVLTDEATYQEVGRRYVFETLEPITLKGKTGLFTTYRPLSKRQHKVSTEVQIVGRSAEREAISAALDSLAQRHQLSRIVLEGEAGIGKSALISFALSMASAKQIRHLVGIGDEVEHDTPFHGWKGVFEAIFGFDDIAEAAHKRERIQAYFADRPDDLRKVPLLNAVWPVDFSENDLTASLEGQARANFTNNFLLAILQCQTEAEPLVLVLDDCQWFDSASLKLLEQVSGKLENTLLLMAFRSFEDGPPPDFAKVLQASGTHLKLP